MKKVIKYVLVVSFILGGIGTIFKGSFISGFLLTSLGVIFVPQVSDLLNDKIKLWSNKPIRYGVYIGIFILTALTNSEFRNDGINNAASNNKNEYHDYSEKVKTNIKNLSDYNKVSRMKMMEKLKATITYKALVRNNSATAEYLPLLTTINGGVRHSYTNSTGKEVFGMDESIKNSNNGEDKLNFAVYAISLAMPNKGGFPEELVQIFDRYKKKYKLYGVPSSLYDMSGSKNESISKVYNLSAIFGLIQPKDKDVLNAIYESNDKKNSDWITDGNKVQYLNDFIATANGYIKHIKKVYPNSKYLPDDYDDSFWSNYDTMVNDRVLTMILLKDCKGLKEEFNIADANMDSQIARTGTGNTDLMSFIDENMKVLGCYN